MTENKPHLWFFAGYWCCVKATWFPEPIDGHRYQFAFGATPEQAINGLDHSMPVMTANPRNMGIFKKRTV